MVTKSYDRTLSRAISDHAMSRIYFILTLCLVEFLAEWVVYVPHIQFSV